MSRSAAGPGRAGAGLLPQHADERACGAVRAVTPDAGPPAPPGVRLASARDRGKYRLGCLVPESGVVQGGARPVRRVIEVAVRRVPVAGVRALRARFAGCVRRVRNVLRHHGTRVRPGEGAGVHRAGEMGGDHQDQPDQQGGTAGASRAAAAADP